MHVRIFNFFLEYAFMNEKSKEETNDSVASKAYNKAEKLNNVV